MEEEERQGPSNPTGCAGDYSTPTPAGFSLDLHLPLHFEIAFFQPVRISRILKNDGIPLNIQNITIGKRFLHTGNISGSSHPVFLQGCLGTYLFFACQTSFQQSKLRNA